jgi:L-threonylcarbamoyladenylate synthase
MKTEIIRVRGNKIPAKKLQAVAAALKRGEPVIFPTDTVYGIGVSAFEFKGIKKIYTLKGRDFSKPLVWLLDSVSSLTPLVRGISREAEILMKRFWPGPLTLIFRAPQSTIGIRIPGHALTRALIRQAGVPLATTSANKSGCASARRPSALDFFIGKVSFILSAGALPFSKESTVVDVTVSPPLILREGAISQEIIKHALNIS